ncbi:MAG: exo-alpha-sialidase [Ignavibacteriae bacterium]|nr:MAG: exo-alpha-sialidase [Ignavibacteriota bacterium]
MVRTLSSLFMMLVLVSTVCAQPWSFTRLPLHSAMVQPSDLVSAQTLGYTNMPPVVWKDGKRIAATYAATKRITASDVDAGQNMTAVLNDGTLLRVTPDGAVTQVDDFVYSVRGLALTCYDENRTLVVRPDALLRYVLVYDVDEVTTTSIDTIMVDSVTTSKLYNDRYHGKVSLTLQHTVNGRPDTTSFDWDRTTRSWTQRQDVLWGSMIVFPDGDVRWFDRHTILVDGRVLLNMFYIPSVGQVNNIRRSDDRGESFVAVPELDTIVTSIHDVEAWFDGSAMFSEDNNGLIKWFPDGRVVRVESPESNYLLTFSGLLPITAGGERIVGTGSVASDAVFDVQSQSWGSAAGADYVYNAFSERDKVILHAPNNTLTLWDPVADTSFKVLSDPGQSVFINQVVGALPWSDTSSLVVCIYSAWHIVSHTGMLTTMVVNMPERRISDFATSLVSIAGGVVQLPNGDILAGSQTAYFYDSTGAMVPGSEFMGMLRTADTGKTWTESNVGLGTNTYIWDLHRGEDGLLYCIAGIDVGLPSRGSVYISRDEGATWTETPSMLPGSIVRQAKISVSKRGHITVASRGVARSTNGGASWVEITGPWSEDGLAYEALELPWDDRLAVATTQGIYVSDVPVSVNEEQQVIPASCDDVRGQAQIMITDLRGCVVHSSTSVVNGTLDVRSTIPSTIPSGVYLLTVNDCTSTLVITR